MDKIDIHVIDDHAWIFDVKVLKRLRENHNVVSVPTGTLPVLPQQNLFLSLPAELMREEASVLVDSGVARFVQTKHNDDDAPTLDKEISNYWMERELTSRKSYIRDIEASHIKSEILRRQSLAKKGLSINTSESPISSFIIDSKMEKIPKSYNVIIPTISTPSLIQSYQYYDSLLDAQRSKIWSFPSSKDEIILLNIFKDLHKRGYSLTPGIKFGGQWMVYPGDPLRYHSHFIANVITKPVALMDLVGHGRLGTTVKKSLLLCGWNDENDTSEYYCIEWAGFG